MDFAQARFNMVEQQIRPWDILDFELLDVLSEIPREYFVLPEHQALAYVDQALPLANGSAMPEPRIVAKMIQALNIKKTERALEVGTGSGYATAVLAGLADSVLSLDTDAKQHEFAQHALLRAGINNTQLSVVDGLKNLSQRGEFDVVYVGGSISQVPENLLHALKDGGRLVAVISQNEQLMHATLFTRKGSDFAQEVLFETAITALVEAAPAKAAFEF